MQRGNQARESSRPRILSADDAEDSRHLTAMRLARAGYLVDEVHDGEQAWEALAATCYDLLITDHNMPRLFGLVLLARLRGEAEELAVILHSGWPGIGEGPGYGALRLKAVVPKALDSIGLSEAISSVFNTAAASSPSNRGTSFPIPHPPLSNH